MGLAFPPYYGTSKFYKKKIEKAKKIIAEQEAIIANCQKAIQAQAIDEKHKEDNPKD